ncbi:MAG: agmatine deiminase family protein [Pseudomonadota bacterium]|uniref:agmatine deiminase family protein n=1 Tax=Thermithiobacillus tepidarius TaxID=929 RepID=UPI000412E288|nr:agmatine deiminase family protein [Thermithiobacillus tepidarius]
MPQYFLPPEWAPQSAVQLTWPHAEGDWAPHLALVEPSFVEIARQISLRERVLIACNGADHLAHVRALLTRAGMAMAQVRLFAVPSNDTWARDHGPITVLDGGRPLLLDFGFNGWGLKYRANLDNQITRRLHGLGAFGDAPLRTMGLILEGGGIESDGAGTLLTTSQCLLSPNRNPHLDQAGLEAELRRCFGVERVLWLHHGYLAGDDTDSHVDTLARLCDPQTIAYVRCDDPADEHYAELQAMEAELRAFRTADGQPYRLVPLPWPAPKFDAEGERLPATYANFLIINGAVLVPTYDDPKDAEALAALAACFPEREIVGVPCAPLILQFGSLHCVTMQIPQGVVP